MIISPECLLVLNCFSQRVPTRGLFLLNSGMYNTGRNPEAVHPWSGPGWTQCLYTPGWGEGGLLPEFCHTVLPWIPLPFDWGSPLVFWNPAVRTAWELPGWADVFPTKHSAATCRLFSVFCLILSRLLKTDCCNPPIFQASSICSQAPDSLLHWLGAPQLTGCCTVAQFLAAGSAAFACQ